MRTPQQTRAAWDELAAGYDQFVTPTHLDLAEEALRRVGLRAGMRFLDVAAGTGALSIPAARLGAQVLAIDISPTMVARLNQRVQEEGLVNSRAVSWMHTIWTWRIMLSISPPPNMA
jgi:2-polyprenyl-3-methyl-5-hydroxy-6-metoxy-1,4-benzoquinol methylase